MGTIVVKLGSSTVVDEGGAPREDLLRGRVAELAECSRAGWRAVLVSSGAVASGRPALGLPGGALPLADLQAASAVGQARLFEAYRRLFAEEGLTPAQVLLTSSELERRESYRNARSALVRLLDLGAVPVVNENDTTATEELAVGDNDRLAAHVAILLGAELLLLLTDRPGVLVEDSGGPRVLPELGASVATDARIAALGGSAAGRGGIAAKIAAATLAADSGVTAFIASGTEPGVVRTLAGGGAAGTRFPVPDAAGARRDAAGPELDRLAVAWLTDLLVPRDAVQLALGSRAIRRARHRAQEAIVRAGEPGDELFLIVSGEVDVIDETGPRPRVVATLGPGEHFGEMALLGEGPRAATVRCRTATTTLSLGRAAFARLTGRVPEIRDRFAATARDRGAELGGASPA